MCSPSDNNIHNHIAIFNGVRSWGDPCLHGVGVGFLGNLHSSTSALLVRDEYLEGGELLPSVTLEPKHIEMVCVCVGGENKRAYS